FFQAEDGIRYRNVTGVQTCALPICDNELYDVVAFTAAQIPDIDDRKYPSELAGSLYPEGIPIYSQDKLPELISELEVDECVFARSEERRVGKDCRCEDGQ